MGRTGTTIPTRAAGWRGLRLDLYRILFARRWASFELEEVVRRFNTPHRLNDYMQVVFEYVPDEDVHGIDEHWQGPADTHRLRKGDCEDYALFAAHVLERHGYEPAILAVFTEDDGHALCVFRNAGMWHTICNQGLRSADVRSSTQLGAFDPIIARAVAERHYRDRWTHFSFVRELEEAAELVGRARRLVPRYEFVHREG